MMQLLESGEMYLETIFILSSKNEKVRSIDICDYMGYSKPSVSCAISRLKTEKYVTVDKDGYIELTESGLIIAKKIYERHTMITDFLIKLGVDTETATADACKIEHDISDVTFETIKKHI